VAYTTEFFLTQEQGAISSARQIVADVMNLLDVHSVIDVGCGTGQWLREFKERGVGRVRGLDGRWVPSELLKIDESEFSATDLSGPIELRETFDLAISLEVAEHLPESSAEGFVDFLTRVAPVVLFSAATPLQGGTEHVNEQWPAYWSSKFTTRGYVTVDVLRWKIWADTRISWWYRQNLLIFVHADKFAQLRAAGVPWTASDGDVAAVVHPENLAHQLRAVADPSWLGPRVLLRALPRAFARALHWRFGRR
jgi:SAM-dependent methyltransferase